MDSILNTVKKALDVELDYMGFDDQLVTAINTALFDLNQLGIGPTEGFSITGSDEIWTDLIGEAKNIESVKSYVGLKVKLLFDPPSSSFVLDSIDKTITQLGWRLMVQVDPITPDPVVPPEDDPFT
jgi:hypothetical protein